jgi:hypothetical protein
MPCVITPVEVAIYEYLLKARVFVPDSLFQFVGKATGAYTRVEQLKVERVNCDLTPKN